MKDKKMIPATEEDHDKNKLIGHINQEQQLQFRRGNPRHRAVSKTGQCNITTTNLIENHIRFLYDLFTSLIDIKWRYTLIVFLIVYFGSWLFFSLIWWLIMFTHGDLDEEHLPIHQAESNWNPCVLNIHGWTSCFLYSLETQSTIGYGSRTITEECPQAIFIMQIQCMCAMMIDCFMIGVIFAKLTRPKLRTQTILFSKNALINQRNQRYCLMFRIGDISRTRIIGCTIRALLIRFMKTQEGEILKSYQHELQIQADDCSDNPFLLWPMIVCHKIDEKSPFYNLTIQKLRQQHFEIVVLLEGTVESTGQTIQARSSYLSCEILWGYRFESLLTFDKDHQGYEVDYLKFNCIYPVDMPLCSAAEFEAMNPKNDEEIAENDLVTTPSTPETPQPLIYGNYTNFIDINHDYNQSFV